MLVVAGAGSGKTRAAHAPRRASDRRVRGEAERDPRHHVHEQGGRRDALAARGSPRARRRGPSGSSRSTPPAAGSCAGRRRRLGYKSNFTIYDQADQVRLTKDCLEELERDPKRFVPRGIHTPDLEREEPARLAGRVRAPRRVVLRPDGRRRLRPCTSAASTRRTRSTSTTCSCSRSRCSSASPRRASAGRRRFATCSSTSTRTRTTRSTGCSSCSAGEHRNVCAVGDPDQSIYAFRGADIRNILEFERDFPGTRLIALEQNYRSTNTVLRAANAVIANNRERKEKNLFSELGDGPPVRALEVEDEHAEARFVAAEVAQLIEEGWSGSEIAVFYRTNAQSRVLEDVLVRQGIPYQVIGGPRFYERAEIKDVVAYLQVIDNPVDARLADAHGQPPAPRHRRRVARRVCRTWADAHGETPVRGARPRRRRPASARLRRVPSRSSRRCSSLAPVGRAGAIRLRARRAACSTQSGLPRGARGGADDRGARPRSRTSRSSSASPRSTRSSRRSRRSRASSRRSRSTPTRTRSRTGVARHADDAPQREGARVRRRVPDRDGGGDLPARPLDRGAGDRGGAAARVRRHDAREGTADADACSDALAVRHARAQPARRASSTSCRRARSCASASGRSPGRRRRPRPVRSTPRADAPVARDRRLRAPRQRSATASSSRSRRAASSPSASPARAASGG